MFIFYPGVCNFCLFAIEEIQQHDGSARIRSKAYRPGIKNLNIAEKSPNLRKNNVSDLLWT